MIVFVQLKVIALPLRPLLFFRLILAGIDQVFFILAD